MMDTSITDMPMMSRSELLAMADCCDRRYEQIAARADEVLTDPCAPDEVYDNLMSSAAEHADDAEYYRRLAYEDGRTE